MRLIEKYIFEPQDISLLEPLHIMHYKMRLAPNKTNHAGVTTVEMKITLYG